jgi:hypothetical protein
MPFGLKMSQDVFQQRMDGILDKVGDGCLGIADDVIVYGRNDIEHDKHLLKLMTIAQEEGLVFNSEKCMIRTNSIPFFGVIVDKMGIKPDPAKVAVIKEIQAPQNKQ